MKGKNRALLLLAVAACAGCKAEERTVPRVKTVSVNEYPVEVQGAQQFTANKFFLWREPVRAGTVEKVLRAVKKIQDAEDTGRLIREEMRRMERELGDIETEMAGGMRELDPETSGRLEELKQKIAEEARASAFDPEGAAELRREIDGLRGRLPAREALPRAVGAPFARFEEVQARMRGRYAEQAVAAEEQLRRVDEVVENTDYFQGVPERVIFDFSQAPPRIELIGWPKRGEMHSTDDGSVLNVSYEARGGLLKFDVRTEEEGEFSVRLVRTRPEVRDGRVFYQGELMRRRPGQPDQRGVAKLAPGND